MVVLAELNVDVLLQLDSPEVRFGQVETELSEAAIRLGSSGAITAAAVAALDMHVSICGVVGDDSLGHYTVGLLQENGLDDGHVVRRPGAATGFTTVVNAPGGDRALLTFPGTMAALRAADLSEALLAGCQHLHVSSYFLQRGLLPDLPGLFADLCSRGISTSLDTGWDPAESWAGLEEVLGNTTVLFPNEAELRAIADRLHLDGDRSTTNWYAAAARSLSERGPTVALKRGGHGGLVCTPEEGLQLDTVPIVPLDTTGAGDNFNAGFLATMLAGAGSAECLAAAVSAGRMSVQGRGGTGRLTSRDELTDLVARSVTNVRVLW